MKNDDLFVALNLVISILVFIPLVQIIGKAGYSRWWAVAMLVPGVNLILLWVFALSKWPALTTRS